MTAHEGRLVEEMTPESAEALADGLRTSVELRDLLVTMLVAVAAVARELGVLEVERSTIAAADQLDAIRLPLLTFVSGGSA